jgi:predicted permease
VLAIFEVTAPFFALILCGYLAARLRLLPGNAVPALNSFVLYFALPCLLFRFSAYTPFGNLVNLPVFFAAARSARACATRRSARSPRRGRTGATWASPCCPRSSARRRPRR